MPLLQTCHHAFTTFMKPKKLTRLSGFLLFFSLGVVFYLTYCLFNFKEHPDLPWYETGIYEGGLRGFPVAVCFVAVALLFLLFGRGK